MANNEESSNQNAKAAHIEAFEHQLDAISNEVDKLVQKVTEVEQFFDKAKSKSSDENDKDKDKRIPSIKKQPQDTSRRAAVAAKKTQELMRQFGSILRQITQHKWAWPFIDPVDVESLGLHDYYEIIDKPMDLSTIKRKMEAKDGTGYKNVREIYADVKLTFDNAMVYNKKPSDVYKMASHLLENFEEKWQQFLPKVLEEEKRRKEEEAKASTDLQVARVAANADLTRDIGNKLINFDMQLAQLREDVVQKCSKVTFEQKRNLAIALSKLPSEELYTALEMVAESNPELQLKAEEVDLNIDALSESTLWRLMIFVTNTLEAKGKSSEGKSSEGANNDTTKSNKRKRQSCNAGSDKKKSRN